MSPPSLHAVVDAPGELTGDALLEAHADQLGTVVEAVGVEPAAEASGIGPETLRAVADGDVEAAGALDLAAVAAVLALPDGAPAPAALVDEALEELLFGMTAGVLDVDRVAADAPGDLEPREVQAMLEGRHPLTLRQYAGLRQVIASRAV